MARFLIHYFLHLVFPAFIAYGFYKKQWLKVYGILVLTMLVDLDHLLAHPIYDPQRCSVGFHPLHSYIAIAVYLLLLLFKRLRIVAAGLLLHIATDYLDCTLRHI